MIIVKNRELLIPLPERYLGTSYDTSSEVRQFRISRFAQNGTDLSPLTFYVDLLHADGSSAYDTITMGEVGDTNYKVVDDNYIILTWYITRNVLQNPGVLFVQLRAMDSENTVRWGSFKAAFYVERHLNAPGNYGGSLTLIEQIQQDHNYFKSVIAEVAALPQYVGTAEAWAVGQRNGHAVESGDVTYQNNSKWYATRAEHMAENAYNYMGITEAMSFGTVDGEPVGSDDPNYHNNAKYYADNSHMYAINSLSYSIDSQGYSWDAEAWASGQRNGTDVALGDPTYQNNAKYYSEQADASSNIAGVHKDAAQLAAQQAANSATAADGSATAASVSAGRASAAMLAAQNASNDARAAADTAAQKSTDSSGYAQDSEAWAVGQRDGVDVDSSDPAYHNNAKYYKDQSTTWAGFASGSMLNSEAWAVGQKNGTDVPATAEQYHNNSKYYSEQAAAAATRAESAAESLTVDAELSDSSTNPVQNKVITGELTDVKNHITVLDEYGATNRFPYLKRTTYPNTLTIVQDNEKITVSGTPSITGFIHNNIFNDRNSFPTGIAPGMELQAVLVCEDDGIRFEIAEMDADTTTKLCIIDGSGIAQIKISENATGCYIRSDVASGKTYNEVVAYFYIFGTLTKQQVENAIDSANGGIDKNASDITKIANHMPMAYMPVEVTPEDGLVNKYNGIAGPSGWAYIKQSVTPGEKYKASGNYYGGNFPAYLLLNGDSVLSFHNEDATGAFYGVEVTIPENATHIIVNGNTASPASLSRYEMTDAGIRGAKSYDSVLVGKSTDYAYTDINTAVVEHPGEIITVDYGTYETEIENLATDKTIIGKDRNLCVLTGTGRNYDTPPIEIAGGIIKHFTVNMVNAEDASHTGYCLHSDTSACIGKTLIVDDCAFVCTGQHTIGMGIWPGESVLYKGCEFIMKDVEETPTHAPFFAHNAGASDGIAVVRFHNCIFRGHGYALKLSSYSSNCTMQFEFIDCTFESDTLTGNDIIWTDYVAGDTHDQSNLHNFKGKMPLLKTSHGNNVSIANYST